ncbi:MAG: winged helix-turn-helix transcriptional regulator [Thermoplasmata archaeon]|nr:MAG: winged helix-turn-helix transcriptional regulator [Thermoplasmata archaeon]
MRSRKLSILLLAILAALVVVAIHSAGQTPPPASGDWEIYDNTVISDTSVTIQGNVHVYGYGSLTLVNVDLTLDTSIPMVVVEQHGRLSWSGGSLDHTSTFAQPRITLTSNCSIDRVTFGKLYGVMISEFGVNVTNCTFGGGDSIGIMFNTHVGSPTDKPIVIADNTFMNMRRSPIGGSINSATNDTVGLVLVGNTILMTQSSDAINVTVMTSSAHLVVTHNTISGTSGNGIRLNLICDDLFLRLDDNSITDAGGHGVVAYLDTETLDFPGITDLSVVRSGIDGLVLKATGNPIDDLVLINHTNRASGRNGVSLQRAYNVTITDSRIVNATTDLWVSHGTVKIFRTLHERGDAVVIYADSSITSFKWFEMWCQWQNGLPAWNQYVEVRGPVDASVLYGMTDRSGYWGNETYADWHMTSTTNDIATNLTPVLLHPMGDIVADDTVPTENGGVYTVTFTDTTGPAITVSEPSGDVVQNSTAFQIRGTARDHHSSVALVQYSFDPNPDWDTKIWSDTTGTSNWYADSLHLPEGLHILYVRAFDGAGVGTDMYTGLTVGQVLIDMSPPVVQVTSPDVRRQPVIVNATTLPMGGWVSEPVTSVTVQGDAVSVSGTVFTVDVPVSEGLNDITIVATDLAGNVGTLTLSVLRDSAAPTITLTAPVPGALLNDTSVLVAGLLDEPVQDDLIVINGAPVTLSSGAFQVLLNGFGEGPSTIDVTAVDLAGNTASVSVDVIVDTLPPALELVSPIDGLLTRQATVLLEGTSEAGAVIHVQGEPVAITGTAFSHDLDLVEGRNIIRVTSVDAAGNVNSTMVVVDRDSTPPVLELYGLSDGAIESEGRTAFLNGRTEAGAALRMTIGTASEEVITFPDGTFLQPLTVDGNVTVTLRAEDAAGNTAFAQVEVVYRQVSDPGIAPPEPEPVDPVVTAAVVTTSLVVIVGVAMTFEFTKYALVLMVLPLYARIKKHEVLDNKTRLAIHGLVVENPGMHYNEIIREFDLTNGVAAYHLDVLEREGFVRSVRDGTLRRFYSSSTKVPGDHRATPDQTREHILEMVTENPGINQKTIVDELGIGRTLVGYHLKTLIDEGYIEAHKQGRFTVYSRTRKRWFRLN